MHLFLEGPVKTGKSTLIRRCIAPYMNRIGGFSSQRLWLKGKPCGYRLTGADVLDLDAPFDETLSGLFIWHTEQDSGKNPLVFETLGVRLLEEAKNSSLILLDEIGGSELAVPCFRTKLYEILEGSVPCIGVLKLASKASFMTKAAGYPDLVLDCNEQLRRDLTSRFHGSIYAYEPERQDFLEREIKSFLERIFSRTETV